MICDMYVWCAGVEYSAFWSVVAVVSTRMMCRTIGQHNMLSSLTGIVTNSGRSHHLKIPNLLWSHYGNILSSLGLLPTLVIVIFVSVTDNMIIYIFSWLFKNQLKNTKQASFLAKHHQPAIWNWILCILKCSCQHLAEGYAECWPLIVTIIGHSHNFKHSRYYHLKLWYYIHIYRMSFFSTIDKQASIFS